LEERHLGGLITRSPGFESRICYRTRNPMLPTFAPAAPEETGSTTATFDERHDTAAAVGETPRKGLLGASLFRVPLRSLWALSRS
jgi:hypothetical protein